MQDVLSFDGVKVWKQGGVRAPHKPLLLLFALAALQRGEPRLLSYAEVEAQLVSLLRTFGPPRRSYSAQHPFWRLQNDGDFWVVPQRETLLEGMRGLKRQGDAPRRLLRELGAQGGFSQEVYAQLTAAPAEVNRLVFELLEANFPSSMHEDILDAVGMPWVTHGRRRRRDPEFRKAILRIYEHRCAVCGFDGRLGDQGVGLEAAHVRWHAAGGPDREDNGVALCVLHHKLFDRGALGVDPTHRILVSQDVHGSTGVQEHILRYAGEPLRGPQPGAPRIAQAHIAWHHAQVFQKPARPLS